MLAQRQEKCVVGGRRYPVIASATKVSTTHAESATAPSLKRYRAVDRRVLAMDWGIISTPPPLRPPPPSSSRWPCVQRLKVRRPFGWKLHLRRAHGPVSVFFSVGGNGLVASYGIFFFSSFFVLFCFAILRICLFVVFFKKNLWESLFWCQSGSPSPCCTTLFCFVDLCTAVRAFPSGAFRNVTKAFMQ